MIAALVAALALDAYFDGPLTPPPGGEVFRTHFKIGMLTVSCSDGQRMQVDEAWMLTVKADGSAVLTRRQRDCPDMDREVKLTADQAKPFAPLFDPAAYQGFSEQRCLDGAPTVDDMAAGDRRASLHYQCHGPAALTGPVSQMRMLLAPAKR